MKLSNLITANIVWVVLFLVSLLFFQPDGVEQASISAIMLSWVMYIAATMLSILTFALMPYTKALLEGRDQKYGVEERKTALLFMGMIALANAILFANIIGSLFIPNYAAG